MTESAFSTFYPHLREVLDERFATLSDDELEALFAEALGEGITPAEYEEFFGGLAKGIGRFAKRAAPVVAPIAQGALQGATTGSVAGPWGALAGGLAGGVGSALQRHGRGPARNVGNVLGSVVGAAGALGGRGAAVKGVSGVLGALGQSGAGQPAINALRGVLGRPETGAALRALIAGRNPAIPVGRSQVPVPANAFAGLLGALAREAEAEAEGRESLMLPAYLLDTDGQPVVDPTVPEERAAQLLHLLAGASLEAEMWDADSDTGENEDGWEEIESEDVWADLADDDLLENDDLLDTADRFEVW